MPEQVIDSSRVNDRDPDRRQLAIFGALLPLFFLISGALLRWRWGLAQGSRGWWIAGATIWMVYLLWPASRRHIYRGWMAGGGAVRWLVSQVTLAVVFFGVFAPIGLLLRLFRHDPLSRRATRDAPTYWKDRAGDADGEPPAERYLRPY